MISQIYGGGGNTGSTLTNDYIELINHSSSPVNLSGWSVQAWVPLTSTWEMTRLPISHFSDQYYLVKNLKEQAARPVCRRRTRRTILINKASARVVLVNNTTRNKDLPGYRRGRDS